jgi:uncharacterized protein
MTAEKQRDKFFLMNITENVMLARIEPLCESYMSGLCGENPDPSHDILHVKRVVNLAKKIALAENADLNVVVPAAYLHDCVYISKTDSRRKEASRISADKAVQLLQEWNYPEKYLNEIHHAVLAHSFSAGFSAETIEARVVQDADRLDAIGAIGIARCFAFSGLSNRALHNAEDPFCDDRNPNDKENTLDHFFIKLLGLSSKLHTSFARTEGEKRLHTMNLFLDSLKTEITGI